MRHCVLPLAFAAVVVPALVHGLWTGRWVRSEQLERFTERLAKVPKVINDWEGIEEPADERELSRADLTGLLKRRYVHRASRQQIMVLVACGRGGPVSLHTPDVCYENSGYRTVSPEQRHTFKQAGGKIESEFKAATFAKAGPAGDNFTQIYWCWSSDGAWRSPTVPRIAFGREPALYKLYVSYVYRDDAERKELDGACKDFANVLLPALQEALFERPRGERPRGAGS